MKLGISVDELNNALEGLLGYVYVNDYPQFGKLYKVEVQADQQFRVNEDSLKTIYVRSDKGKMIPISTFTKVETRFAPQYLSRYNRYSSANINGEPAPGYSSGEAMAAMERIGNEMPDGMRYEWTDMSYQEKLAAGQLGIILFLALLFIYLFLVAQYESWMIPVSVMASVPIAFAGALAFLYAANVENNLYTQVGFVLLFGMACKTAILIVEYAKLKREEGKSIYDAAMEAARLRFRAVLMTAISFVLGTMPLVTAVGAGAVSRRSLGTAVFGGMTVAAVLGTILIPVFYLMVQHIIEWKWKKDN
jgi:HAE1 family hydrophobic/amphiphilic exporter-1